MRPLAAFLFVVTSAPALAQSVVVSKAPVSTSVTVYRDSDRVSGSFELDWLEGYALITEKRHVALPAGEAVVRFEGVADGMIAVSAVVSGLPGRVEEKNRNAKLLSPASLLDGSLGNRVHIRRTNPATGEVTESDAIVRSGADGAVVLQTHRGAEALRCSGLPETLTYDTVPSGLLAKPSFSIHTNTRDATEADVTLTYLAAGFDWGASYVATVAEDGKTLDLSAWLTVANGNGATFKQAQLMAVAGTPNRTRDLGLAAEDQPSPQLAMKCWPMDSTSTHPPTAMPGSQSHEEITVTTMKRSVDGFLDMLGPSPVGVAAQENIGDLKLYHVPVLVDVLPNSQKQVALLEKNHVPLTRIYAAKVYPGQKARISAPLTIVLRMQNEARHGLGLPLPSGGVIVMQKQRGVDLLLANGQMADKAVGEKVEITAGVSDQLRIEQRILSVTAEERHFRVTLTNALGASVPVELKVPRFDGYDLVLPAKLVAKGGDHLWIAKVPANGRRQIDIFYKRQ